MALIILGKTECSLCGRIIGAGDDIVSTSHFISEQHDPLWQFSDSAMHRYCFLDWDHRKDFVEKFNRTAEGTTGKYHRMGPTGIFQYSSAVVNPRPHPTSGWSGPPIS